MTCSTGWLRNGELRKHRVVMCVAGVLVYSQHFLILHCLFFPRPLQLEMVSPHAHHLSGRTEVGTVGVGSFHYQWLQQRGSFSALVPRTGAVFSSGLEWWPKLGSHGYTTVQIILNYSAGLGEMAWGQCTKRCATLQMLKLKKLYIFHQKGNFSVRGTKAAKKEPYGYSVRKGFCNYILLLKSYPLKF